jgi:DNA polymerase III sliding clamp (beta) subunit (PCNA family)
VELRVNTEKIRDIVNRVIHTVETKAELEAFREIAVRVSGGKMHLATTMPGIETVEFMELGEKVKKTLLFSIPAKTFQNILNTIQTEELTLKLTDHQMQVNAGRSHFRIARKRGEDALFPDMSRFSQDTMTFFDTKHMCTVVKKASSTADKDGARPYFSVIHFNGKEAVSTDGRVMSLLKTPFTGIIGEFNLNVEHSLRLAKAFHRIGVAEGQYSFNEHHVYFEVGNLKVVVAAASMAYPNYKGIVVGRTAGHKTYEIPKQPLLSAVQQMAILSQDVKEKTRVVEFAFREGGIFLSSKTDVGDSETFVDCENISRDQDPVFFDVDLLLKGVSSLESSVIEVMIDTPQRPALFAEKDYVFYINPMRFK